MFNSTKDRYDKFAVEYVTNGENGAKAARDAKFSVKCAAQTATRLLKNSYVIKKIDELKAVIKQELSPEGIKRRFSEQYLACVGNNDRTNAIRILENQGKIVGIYELDNKQKAELRELTEEQIELSKEFAAWKLRQGLSLATG